MNAAQVDAEGAIIAEAIRSAVAFEGIVGPLTIGKSARIRTIARDAAGDEWTFAPMVDVKTNAVVVTAIGFHGKVEA